MNVLVIFAVASLLTGFIVAKHESSMGRAPFWRTFLLSSLATMALLMMFFNRVINFAP